MHTKHIYEKDNLVTRGNVKNTIAKNRLFSSLFNVIHLDDYKAVKCINERHIYTFRFHLAESNFCSTAHSVHTCTIHAKFNGRIVSNLLQKIEYIHSPKMLNNVLMPGQGKSGTGQYLKMCIA